MTNEANINGITIKDIERMMKTYERRIAFFNKKFDYGNAPTPERERKSNDSDLRTWDFMKAKRDTLKAQASK